MTCSLLSLVKTAHFSRTKRRGGSGCVSAPAEDQCCEFFIIRSEEDLASLNTVVTDELGISSSSLSCWMNKLPQYHFLAKLEKERFSLHQGHSNELDAIRPELLAFVGDLREKGCSRKMIATQTCRILGPWCAFSCKSYAARAQSVSCWMKNNNLTIQVGTHQGPALT